MRLLEDGNLKEHEMKKLMALLGGVGCVAALQGCMVAPDGAEESISTVDTNITSSLRITQSWYGGYCAEVSVANTLTVKGNDWKVVLDMNGSTIQAGGSSQGLNMWNAKASGTSGRVTFTAESYNQWIDPGTTRAFGFCADGPTPAIAGYNMTSTQYAVCTTNSGVNPTKAGLAVSMATELGRWKPESDLYIGWDGKVALTSGGLSRCTNGCANTKAILAMQNDVFTQIIGQENFNATMFREELKASFGRQQSKLDDLNRNAPWNLPPAHKLTLVAGPTNLGNGSCGPHYIYKATDLNGVPLTSTQATNLQNALCFYGQGTCGGNPYIAFISDAQCPSGQKCVAIDPTDTVNSTTNTTSAGTAPTYPYNKAYDPNGVLLNTACITTTAKLGKMLSKCSTLPSTCGWDFCTAY
jgi:hypothetical protein